MTPQQPPASQSLQVFDAADFVASDGVAEGDPISFADDLVMDDSYRLRPGAARRRIEVAAAADPGAFDIVTGGTGSRDGSGLALHLDSCLTLMAPDGSTCEALLLVEVDAGNAVAVYLLPLAVLLPGADYRLVGADRHAATQRLAELACVSFGRGTRISLASGAQVRIEDLRVGDRVLTRDDGPQPIRWIGETVLRATGDFAPVVIRAGALHNSGDLVVSPEHRIFVYQRRDQVGAGRPELLVKARHLVNGDTVLRAEGGFVDYFQLAFDDHQIIYAEGIAAESLLIDRRTHAALPEGLRSGAGHAPRRHLSYEVSESLLSGPDAVALLRRASASG